MKRTFALLLALVLALVIVVPVSADPPDVQVVTAEENYLAFDHSICPDIAIWDRELYTLRFTSYFDNQGNLVRVTIHGSGIDHFYNPENPGFELTSQHFVGNLEVDLQTGAWVNGRGVPYHLTVPGFGTVLLRAGLWTVYPDGHIAGKDSETDPKDMAQFCSLLASD